MSIAVKCGVCGKNLTAPDSAAGTRAKCPECGELLRIPKPKEPPPTKTPRPGMTAAVSFRCSRWAMFCTGSVTNFFYPPTCNVGDEMLETKRVASVFWPQKSQVERMPLARVASYVHNTGVFWDSVILETAGGANALGLHGLRKPDAERLTQILDERLAAKSSDTP